MTQHTTAMGIDIGGTGIKGAVVSIDTGELVTERIRIPTPHPSTPEAVVKVVAELTREAGWTGPVGATFPAIIKNGVARSAANVDHDWVGTDVDGLFTEHLGSEVVVLNDADAAGLAEVRFGAARDTRGVVIMLTFGTGIGSALFVDGHLVPNTELGHLRLHGHDAEKKASALAREENDLSWHKWSERVQDYMSHVEALFSPDLFVVGGGVSKKAEKWVPSLQLHARVEPARLLNEAGIVGAALAVVERSAGS